MNPSNSLANNGMVDKFLHIPYDKRWEYLKLVLIRMYINENNTFKRISERMKEEYSFTAYPDQYRAHFRRWGIKKSITTKEKNAAISVLGKRLRQDGISTSDVTISQGGSSKNVDKKQLKRYINDTIRRSDPLILHPGTFLRHNIPYAARTHGLGERVTSSTLSTGPHTLSYITAKSPEATTSGSRLDSALSPTMQLVKRNVLLDRSRLFLEGREQELLAELTVDERDPPSSCRSILEQPTQLCRWSIHHRQSFYEPLPPLPTERNESEDAFDNDDESTWSAWRANSPQRSIVATITQGLQENPFSSIDAEDLPLAADAIVKAVQKSPDGLKAEAFGFAIRLRNKDIMEQIIKSYGGELPEAYPSIFPFHVTARYLDGAKTCCLVMNTLVNILHGANTINMRYVDDSGFTVLDTLLVSILRSHSQLPLEIVCGKLIHPSQYSGQDVDPCGIWDADSPCIRQLYASGRPSIPNEWKHIFCHTSVQAVCHSISAMFCVPWRPKINTPSGLFIRRCSCCGLELKLGPLHALILTAFFLADKGMHGENLFGMICCLVCLIAYRADPSFTAEVSIPELLGHGLTDDCQHFALIPAELASKVRSQRRGLWTDEVHRGWDILISILQLDRQQDKFHDCDSPDHLMDRGEQGKIIYCANPKHGHMWAAVQAELLTYRRLSKNDNWLSPNFNTEKLQKGLEDNDEELLREFAQNPDGKTGESKLQEYSNC
ncbi:uncharacterized protein F4812DRAFT_470365 [Daldinia caldariorum]|uniref:uncharacterized protein n=1 Tax=Daldinia caldariorum TaxID=326644 RepID=UPI002007EAFA|nr:uncharacterized protein F4812DRAFT_470365 [Daldinia caldariorum]KAI1469401.1 hypothetical protein F4812DRAFT_470365 [Daldinia caldariorum]